MVLLGHHTIGAHRTPGRPRLKTLGAIAAAVTLLLTAVSYAVWEYNDRPPWADDIAYESGFIAGSRARHYDRTGAEARKLLKGGCERWRSAGRGGEKAGYNPALWVEGCRDGAAGRQARKQGMAH
ncbi:MULTISPECIES: hypothetical protein [unclassified Streptomyces]|uniref:Uncharacterized protein n=1 Tax=Streptomyces sp. NBC_00060 TaxID=2975636 RepID=A0AAU2GV01_9ACTN